MKKLKLDDWVTQQRRRKWRWAHKLATSEEFNWATATLHWDPTLNSKLTPHRRTGRPKTRWADDICKFVSQLLHPTTTCTTTNNDTIDTTTTDDGEDDNHDPPPQPDNTTWLQHAHNKTLWEREENRYVQKEY